MSTILLFGAMFLDGAHRFFSWYLLWGLSLFSLAKSSFTRNLSVAFSLSGLMSYMAFLFTGEYSPSGEVYRIGILFSLPVIYTILTLFRNKFRYL